ncbi:MAG: hypothetical protein ACYDDF_06580 [Thermoplasmatota archaeon]
MRVPGVFVAFVLVAAPFTGCLQALTCPFCTTAVHECGTAPGAFAIEAAHRLSNGSTILAEGNATSDREFLLDYDALPSAPQAPIVREGKLVSVEENAEALDMERGSSAPILRAEFAANATPQARNASVAAFLHDVGNYSDAQIGWTLRSLALNITNGSVMDAYWQPDPNGTVNKTMNVTRVTQSPFWGGPPSGTPAQIIVRGRIVPARVLTLVYSASLPEGLSLASLFARVAAGQILPLIPHDAYDVHAGNWTFSFDIPAVQHQGRIDHVSFWFNVYADGFLSVHASSDVPENPTWWQGWIRTMVASHPLEDVPLSESACANSE